MTEIKDSQHGAGGGSGAPACSRFLQVPLDVGVAFIPLGMTAESFDLMVATLELWRPRIVEGPLDQANRPDRPQATYRYKQVIARSMAIARHEGSGSVTLEHLQTAISEND